MTMKQGFPKQPPMPCPPPEPPMLLVEIPQRRITDEVNSLAAGQETPPEEVFAAGARAALLWLLHVESSSPSQILHERNFGSIWPQ